MAIDYSQRPAGTSKREWTAIQTGQPMPYAKSTPSIYSGQNVVSAISSPYNRPDYSNVSNIYASLNKSIENLNKYDEQLAKGQATIARRRIGLTPMGRQADEAARIGAIGRTGYANQVDAYTGALNAAKDAYNMAMTQYNADRDYALKARSAANEMLPGQSVASMAINKAEQALGVKANENWGAVSNWLQANNYDLTQGGEIDNELRRRNNLPAIGVSSPEIAQAWATRIQNGQAKLTDIPASQADLRNQVAITLSEAGNNAEGKPTTTELGKEALTMANELMGMFNEGKGTSAVGKSRLLGLQYISGTAPFDFANAFQSLKDKLSLEGVKYLKGQGQVSDAERAMLASAVTELKLGQSEDAFKKSLQKIIDKLSGGLQQGQTELPPTGTTSNGLQYQITY